jgi:hypothetical protein
MPGCGEKDHDGRHRQDLPRPVSDSRKSPLEKILNTPGGNKKKRQKGRKT